MLKGIVVLLVFELLGEFLVTLMAWPVPGPVAGMVLLLMGLVIVRGVPVPVRRAADGLLPYLPLLIVPISVGIMQHWQPLRANIWPVLAALALSFAVALPLSGWLMQRLIGNR